ncbi:MAG: retroviral-like aspartic protease family protein [Bacteroidia bacterium]|nr:retroviral-like aspartic protease family protein [Bacteroidia bacterium]
MVRHLIPLHLLKIQGLGIHLYIHTYINGKPARMIVDTGASQSVLDVNRVEKFNHGKALSHHEIKTTGLGTNNMQSFLLEGVTLKTGRAVFKNIEFICIDLSHINNSFQEINIKPVDGVIGGDFLLKHKAVIDYNRKKLTILG